MNTALQLSRGVNEEAPESRDGTHVAGISQVSFQRLIENNADGVLVVDMAGTVLYANPAAAQILGQPLPKLLHVPLGRPVTAGETTEITVPQSGGKPAKSKCASSRSPGTGMQRCLLA